MPRLPALAAFSQARFGVRTQVREQLLTVTSAGTDLGANPNRIHLLLVNHGGVYATVTTERPGSIDRGIRLDPNGGSAAFEPELDGEGVGYGYRLFSSGADVSVSVWETIALDSVDVQ